MPCSVCCLLQYGGRATPQTCCLDISSIPTFLFYFLYFSVFFSFFSSDVGIACGCVMAHCTTSSCGDLCLCELVRDLMSQAWIRVFVCALNMQCAWPHPSAFPPAAMPLLVPLPPPLPPPLFFPALWPLQQCLFHPFLSLCKPLHLLRQEPELQ